MDFIIYAKLHLCNFSLLLILPDDGPGKAETCRRLIVAGSGLLPQQSVCTGLITKTICEWPTNIWHHLTKFSHSGDLTPRNCAP
jgi:hypothetical protein